MGGRPDAPSGSEWPLSPEGKLFGHVAGISGDPREDAVVWEQALGR